jgi:hypothetical protein
MAKKKARKAKPKRSSAASIMSRVVEHLRLTAQAMLLVEESQKHRDSGRIQDARRALAAAERLLKKRNALRLRQLMRTI